MRLISAKMGIFALPILRNCPPQERML